MGISVKNLQDKVKKAVQVSADMNEAKAGGEYSPPAAGLALLRFVGWVELGQHKTEYAGQTKTPWKAEAIFELHGKKYPVEEYEGKKYAKRITVKLNVPAPGQKPSAKSVFYKLFKAMNWEGKYTHMAEMLGQDFLGDVYHREWEHQGRKGIAAQFNNPEIEESPLSIRSPHVSVMNEDNEPETKRVKVPEPISDLRLFLWSAPDAEQWASIYIPGEYPEEKDEKTGKVTKKARSKNVWQETIKASIAFEGSEVEALLLGDPDVGEDDDPAEAVKEAQEQAAKAPKGKGSTKGSGKGKKASQAPENAPADDVKQKASGKGKPAPAAENPLDALEDLDDDIPF